MNRIPSIFIVVLLAVASVIGSSFARDAALQNYYCAGVSTLQAQRDNHITVSTQSNDVFVGSIGGSFDFSSALDLSITNSIPSSFGTGAQKYDAATFALKSSLGFPKTARFQCSSFSSVPPVV
jgi:predicted ATP-dependent serine protease